MNVRRLIALLLVFIPALHIFAGCDKYTEPAQSADIKRIVSLSPSITGQIIDLDAEDMLAGVTTWHPPLKKEIPVIGTYISPSIEKIISLKPDIIFISDEEGEVQRDYFIRRFNLRYYKFGKNRGFDSICENYLHLAGMIGRGELAASKIGIYRERLRSVKKSGTGLRVAFLVSVKPMVTVSGWSFISDIIRDTGAENIYSELDTPYPLITMESLVIKNPDAVIVMFKGDDIFLYNRLRHYRSINFINRKCIFVADENTTPYYTPGDYVKSVEHLSGILSRAGNE